jgi:hypothetical protein
MHVKFTTSLLKFGSKGEKTGWTYIEIPAKLTKTLNRGNRKSFRVAGRIDALEIKGVALIPMGEGDFIMAVNATMRKALKKVHGDEVVVEIYEDVTPFKIDKDLKKALDFEREAQIFWANLPKSEQRYFSKWISSAKTVETKANRIAKAIVGLERKQKFGEMLRALKKAKQDTSVR